MPGGRCPVNDGKHIILKTKVGPISPEQERHFLAAVVDSSKDSVVTIDFDGMITSWNKSAENLYGYPADEAVGKNLSIVLLPDDIRQLLVNIERIKNSKAVEIYDTVRIHKGGNLMNLEVMLSPVRDERGEVIGVSTIARNITDRVRAEEALRKSEARFRALVSQSAVGIYQADLDRVITFVNDTLCNLLGFTREELIGKPLWATTNEEDAEREKGLFDDFKRNNSSFETDKRIVRKNGDVRWVKESVSAIHNGDGELKATMGVIIDITNAKLAEKAVEETSLKLRVVLESLPQMTWTNLPDGKVDFYNTKWYEYTGLPIDQNKAGLWKEVVHPDDLALTVERFERALKTGDPFEVENRCKKFDGTYRWHLSRALPVKNEKEELLMWVGTSTDIHEQKVANDLLEKVIHERTIQLERSNEDLLHFAHVASHDLKEPLRKIVTFSYRLKDEYSDNLPEKARTYIDKIHNATDRMNSMIEGILSYSKVNAFERIEPVDLNTLVKNIEQDLEVVFQQKQASLIVEPLPVLQGSAVLMYQLFYNLINNALKFSRPDVSPVITISAATPEGHPDLVLLEISDNGIGFEQKFAKQIFETFVRLNSKDRYEGTGLGLALCYKIVQRHGGTIDAIGRPGEGATFRIILPKG